MRNVNGQQGVASKLKMSGSEKIKANMNTSNKTFGEHHMTIPPWKYFVTRKFRVLVVQNNGKEMYQKLCCSSKFACVFFAN